MGAVRELTERPIEIPGVVAVTLRGSRAGGAIHPDTDWDFGLYHREAIRVDDVRALGFQGTVVEPEAWGRLVNGGGWLTVEDQRVNLRYRDLDIVRHWLAEAEAGRYEVDQVEGYVAGMATYVPAGELALAELLAGQLPRPGFPEALRQAAPAHWRRSAGFSLAIADTAAARHDVVSCAGLLAKAAIEAAQAALCCDVPGPHPSWRSCTPISCSPAKSRRVPKAVSDLRAEVEAGLERHFHSRPVTITWARRRLSHRTSSSRPGARHFPDVRLIRLPRHSAHRRSPPGAAPTRRRCR
jgi:hypothetical protein